MSYTIMEARELAQFLFLEAVLVFSCEYLTRRSPATWRYVVMMGAWGVLVWILIWVMRAG